MKLTVKILCLAALALFFVAMQPKASRLAHIVLRELETGPEKQRGLFYETSAKFHSAFEFKYSGHGPDTVLREKIALLDEDRVAEFCSPNTEFKVLVEGPTLEKVARECHSGTRSRIGFPGELKPGSALDDLHAAMDALDLGLVTINGFAATARASLPEKEVQRLTDFVLSGSPKDLFVPVIHSISTTSGTVEMTSKLRIQRDHRFDTAFPKLNKKALARIRENFDLECKTRKTLDAQTALFCQKALFSLHAEEYEKFVYVEAFEPGSLEQLPYLSARDRSGSPLFHRMIEASCDAPDVWICDVGTGRRPEPSDPNYLKRLRFLASQPALANLRDSAGRSAASIAHDENCQTALSAFPSQVSAGERKPKK